MAAPLEALTNATVHTGRAVLSDSAVLIEDGRIADILPNGALPPDARKIDLAGGALAPGFIDLQVNGGGGLLFNNDPTPETIATIGRAHRAFGTTGFLPTFVTGEPALMARAISAVKAAMDQKVPGVLGIHLEGPHLNAAKRGVHDPRFIRPPQEADLDALCALKTGETLITLAPECVSAGFIRALVTRGARVSAGHTTADHATLEAAIAEGLTGFTHLFNAMGPLGSREPGAVGTALADDATWCGIIVDGHHVHPAVVHMAWHAKPSGRLFLVTDAMPPVGTDMTRFQLGEQSIAVENGRCVTDDGRLAGSALDMASAVRNAVAEVGIPLDEALRMASAYPAAFLGLDGERGHIAPGYRADLVLLDNEQRTIATWIGGACEESRNVLGGGERRETA